MTSGDWWVMLTAVLCALPCSVLGCFLVLRRMSLLGDAITHAILPGIVLAFVLTGSRGVSPMLAGAAAAGILTALLSGAINRWGKVDEGASLGLVFSTMFALGVVMLGWVPRTMDLDPGCVLYGIIEGVPFDTTLVLGFAVPKAALTLGIVTIAVLALVIVFFKELRIVCFDPQLATTLGISAAVVHYALLGSVATTAVASFEAVGSILVITMLVAPAATAQMLTDKLGTMVVVAAIVGILDAIVGHLLAVMLNSSVAGMMSVAAGIIFVTVALASPRHGVIGKIARRALLRLRIAEEDVLGTLYRNSEADQRLTITQSASLRTRRRLVKLAVWRLTRAGQISNSDGRLHLTEKGLVSARSVVRSHRLWEAFLAKHSSLPLDHLHDPSERVEHFITAPLQEELAREAGECADPHGKAIPPR